MKPFIPFQ